MDTESRINVFQYSLQGIYKMQRKIIYQHNLNFVKVIILYMYLLIDDNNIKNYIIPHRKYNSLAFYNFKSDIVRYYILHKYGGFWFDTDVIKIKDINNLYKSLGEYECMS